MTTEAIPSRSLRLGPALRLLPSAFAFYLPAAVFICLLLIVPFLSVLQESLRPSGTAEHPSLAEHYVTIASNRVYRDTILGTIRFAFVVTGITLLVGYPVAYTLSKAPPGRLAAYSLIILSPLFVNLVVRAYGWIVLLSKHGVVNSTLIWTGLQAQPAQLLYTDGSVLVGMVHIESPYMILSILASLSTLDPALPDAAANLGANPRQAFLYITLPLSVPGIVAGATVVFTSSVSAFVLPLLLGGIDVKLIGMLLYQQVMVLGNYPFGSALAVAIYALTLLSVTVSLKLVGRVRAAGVGSV